MSKGMTPAELLARLAGDQENAHKASLPFGIEAQEMDGQQEMIATSVMPRLLRPTRQAYDDLGFAFGKPLDDLFVEAALPEGWAKVATDHAMWSDLVDGQGRKRGSIFYKAAFYDKQADARLTSRYSVSEKEVEGDETMSRIVVWDAGEDKPVHEAGTAGRSDYAEIRKLQAAAREWLDATFPDNKNPVAYW